MEGAHDNGRATKPILDHPVRQADLTGNVKGEVRYQGNVPDAGMGKDMVKEWKGANGDEKGRVCGCIERMTGT
jgi:hypothetical protein